MSFRILNLAEARFECTFGRGCDGVCCSNGRPMVSPEEAARLDEKLPQILPGLRAPARALVEQRGYLSGRRKCGLPMARVAAGWCVFFNGGCVLHLLGAAEGDAFRYKPSVCSLFPLDKGSHGEWRVRQKGYGGEIWDLFCLDQASSGKPAVESLAAEIALAKRC